MRNVERQRDTETKIEIEKIEREGAIGKTDRLRNGRDHTGSNGDRQTYKENRENLERKGDTYQQRSRSRERVRRLREQARKLLHL